MTDAFADLVMPIFHRLIHLRDRLARGEPKTIDDVRRATTAWVEEADRRAAAAASPELRRSFDRARFGPGGRRDTDRHGRLRRQGPEADAR